MEYYAIIKVTLFIQLHMNTDWLEVALTGINKVVLKLPLSDRDPICCGQYFFYSLGWTLLQSYYLSPISQSHQADEV